MSLRIHVYGSYGYSTWYVTYIVSTEARRPGGSACALDFQQRLKTVAFLIS